MSPWRPCDAIHRGGLQTGIFGDLDDFNCGDDLRSFDCSNAASSTAASIASNIDADFTTREGDAGAARAGELDTAMVMSTGAFGSDFNLAA